MEWGSAAKATAGQGHDPLGFSVGLNSLHLELSWIVRIRFSLCTHGLVPSASGQQGAFMHEGRRRCQAVVDSRTEGGSFRSYLASLRLAAGL